MTGTAAVYTPPSVINTSTMTPTFTENFNSLSLYNTTTGTGIWKTNYQYAYQSDWTSRTLPANGEKQIYVAPAFAGQSLSALGVNPFSLSGGVLSITAAKTPAALSSALWGYKYTSGLLTTETSFSQTYGYFEVRAELPAGKGLWPAFWLSSSDSTAAPEIDVMEQIGGTTVYQTTHTGPIAAGLAKTYATTVATDATAFHTYGVLWTPQAVTFYIDGAKTASVATPADMNKPMYMLLNLAVGGTWPGDPASTFTSAQYKIDYVHAYSLSGVTAADLPDAVTTASSYTLGVGQHSLTLIGAANVNATGNNLGDHLTGNAGSNVLTGGSGGDTLISGAGTDTLVGGYGNDTYVISNALDKIVETSTGGHDLVIAGFTYTLPTYLEDLTLTGGGAAAGVGNGLANKITGNTGANLIDGLTGDDTLVGGLGADTFRFEIHSGHDVVGDFDAHGEKDILNLLNFTQAGYKPVITVHGADTLISLGTGDTITLTGFHGTLTMFSPGLFH